jgi:diaminopimelate epimerase
MPGDAAIKVVAAPLTILDRIFQITCASMGNPHCVIFVDDVENFPVATYGPLIENHELFPRRTNVEFVQIFSRTEVRQRTWERGAGETLACGTGAMLFTAAVSERTYREKDFLTISPRRPEMEWPKTAAST